MFWSSVLHGLSTLAHWQVWLGFAVNAIVWFGWLMAVGSMMGGGSAVASSAGCVGHTILGPFVGGILNTGLVVWLLPVMLGGSNAFPLAMLANFTKPIVAAAVVATISVIILGFIPLIGGFVHSIAGFADFIQGLIVFRLVSDGLIKGILDRGAKPVDPEGVYPSFWSTVGYFAISLTFLYGVTLALAMFAAFRSKDTSLPTAEAGSSIGFGVILARLLAFLPLFMYARQVGDSVKLLVS